MIYTLIGYIKKFDADKFISACKCDRDEKNVKKGEISPLPSDNYFAPSIRKEILEHIKSVSNDKFRKERCGAYLLLSAAVKKMLGFMPPVHFSQSGKPYFDEEIKIYFNISHTTDLVAVSISDESAVGVDAEAEISLERAARLEARFFSELSISERPLDVIYAFCEISEDGNILIREIENKNISEIQSGKTKISSVNQSYSFGARWTIYEASLKCNGGGFTSLPCLGMILLETKSDTVRIVTEDKEFFVTTASS